MQHIYRNWKLALWVAAGVVLGCLGAAQQSAQAQSSVAGWPNREDFTVLPSKDVKFNTRHTVLKRGTFESDEEEQKFAEYYNQSLFPNVTKSENRLSPKDDVLAKLRNDFKSNERAEDKQVFNKLTDLTLDYMSKITKDGRYHPVARVNAMLAIGEVNSPKAVDILLATLGDKNQIDAVRVAAMSDLAHLAAQTQSSLSNPDAAQPVIVWMAKIVRAPIPKNARADGISWMRGQAADVLAILKSTGPQNEVPSALLIMLNDKDLPIPLRSKAARALGKLKYEGNPPAAGPYLTALAEFASDALSSDQPANRKRVRLVARDVEEGLKPFPSPPLSSILKELNKNTEGPLNPEELGTFIATAKTSLDSFLKKKS
ncbi:MAG: hypothetical protein WCJ35_13395 [Planctomycetota bacterium]